ncbi:MAG: hypothetical protein SGI88_00455 [Candidatus Hydrogenedentes bacterium]|nr:hypothetical protein [Candidatus Hydrogenedentota bacterium]
MIRTLSALFPRTIFFNVTIALLIVSALGIDGFARILAWRFELNPREDAIELSQLTNLSWAFVACALALFYAVHRVWSFHPLWRSDYLAWLRTTPWRGGLWLPLGPVHLVWQDAVWVAIPIIIALYAGVLNVLYVAGLFFATHAAMHVVTAYHSKSWLVAFTTAAILSATLGCLLHPLPLVISAFLAYLVAIYGIRKALKKLPYDEFPAINTIILTAQFKNERTATPDPSAQLFEGPSMAILGWPLGLLAPRKVWKVASIGKKIAIPAIFGLYVFALLFVIDEYRTMAEEPNLDFNYTRAIAVASVVILALAMATPYISFCAAPISLLGRFRIGRPIILSYDRLWISVLLSGVATWVLAGIIYSVTGSLSLAIAMAVAVGLPIPPVMLPFFETWFLTGNYRLRKRGSASFKQFKA